MSLQFQMDYTQWLELALMQLNEQLYLYHLVKPIRSLSLSLTSPIKNLKIEIFFLINSISFRSDCLYSSLLKMTIFFASLFLTKCSINFLENDPVPPVTK